MEEMPAPNKPVQRLKRANQPLDLPCSGHVTHSGEISTTCKSHVKKPDGFFLNDNTDVKKFYIKYVISYVMVYTVSFDVRTP
jgi:hypothetical protein